MQVVCPYEDCGKPLEVVVTVRKPGGVSKFTSTRREWLGRIIRPRHYEQTVTPPAINITQPAATLGPLSPGETAYRTLDENADIRPQVRMGLTCAGFVVCLGTCIAAWHWEVIRPAVLILGAGDIVAAAVFLRLNWDVIMLGKTDRLITRTRNADQPITEQLPWHVKAEYQEGRKTLYDEFEITDAHAWHKFCKAVHFDNRNFSGQESRRHNVPPSDWDTVSEQWIRHGWLVLSKRRATPELRGPGNAWVRAYATTPPPSQHGKSG